VTSGRRRLRAFIDYVVEHSLLLAIGSVVALAWANSADADRYHRIAEQLQFPVNDIGMVFFFALAAKEIVEATSPGGALHTWRRAALPAIGAVGGMVAPALIYLAYVTLEGQAGLHAGWAVPCATDIAFSYLVAKLIYKTTHHPAIPFLLLLAIADDALGLVILAMFYPAGELHPLAGSVLLVAGVAVAFGLRRAKVHSFWPYVSVGGALCWLGLHEGGLHPALALVPIIPFLPHAARDRGMFVEPRHGESDPLSRFDRAFKYPVQAVLLLFGFTNSGVLIGAVGAGTWAVLVAIVLGKPLGIALSVTASVAAGLRLPENLRWNDIVVVGFAAGIGFTVALFFAVAAYPPGPILEQLKLGALFSVGSGVLAFAAAALLRAGRFRVSRG
jgi:NhaA family Na+:H+ antiporter